MDKEIKGKIFDIQRYCLDDGNGIRTNVFFKGCPLRCIWCHNIESQSFESEIAFYGNKCISCNECLIACPQKAIDERKNIDNKLCTLCCKCTDVCFGEALVMAGKDMTAEQVFEKVSRDKPFYKNGGGVTLTGGEPMSQPEFALALAKKCFDEGVSVNIETSGYGRKEDFIKMMQFCDCFLFDCKSSDKKHKLLTGVDNDIILDSLNALCEANAGVVLRVPIVPAANLDKDFLDRVVFLASKYQSIKEVHLLPYHDTGLYKVDIFRKEKQRRFSSPSEDVINRIELYLKNKTGKQIYKK